QKSALLQHKETTLLKVVNAGQNSTVFIRNWVLFNRTHLVGMYEYKLLLEDGNGKLTEPYPVFQDDMTGAVYSSGIVPRYMQVHMYMLSKITHMRSFDSSYVPDRKTMEIIDNLISFQAKGATGDVKKAIVKVREIKVPLQFEGHS